MPQARSSGVLRWPNAIEGFLAVITKRLANYALIGSIPVGSTIISGAYTPLRSNIVEQNRTQFRLGWTRGSDWSRFVRTLLGRRNHLRQRCRRRRCGRPQATGAALGQNHRRWRCPPPSAGTISRRPPLSRSPVTHARWPAHASYQYLCACGLPSGELQDYSRCARKYY